MSSRDGHRLGILYEHPEWFKPLFAELDRRGVRYDRLLVTKHSYSPRGRECPYTLVVNRMSPSAYLRGNGHAIFYVGQWLAYLDEIGANVVNSYAAYVLETSKARQLSLLERLGLRYPQAVVIHHPSQAPRAAQSLTFPVVVKPNIGGSGAKIQRFETLAELESAAELGSLDLGIDHTALVQEFLPAAGGHIVRVEVLNGQFLYAIKVFPKPGEGFNLCPADICQQTPGNDLCPGEAVPKLGLQVEGYLPPQQVILDVLRIAEAAHLDVGGIEYLVNERDGQVYYYDINALSNFVSNAPQVVGFDPFPRLVDYLLQRSARGVRRVSSGPAPLDKGSPGFE